MWHGFGFKKRGLIFLSLLFSFLISRIIVSSLFLNDTPLFSFSKVRKSIIDYGSFLANIKVGKTASENVQTNTSSAIDFTAVSPTSKIVLPTESLFLRPTAVQTSIKPSTVNMVRPKPTDIPLYRPQSTKIPPRVPSPTKSLIPLPTTIPSPKVVSYRDPIGLPIPSSEIHDLAVEIGEKVGVPPALILTFMHIETGATFYNLDNAYVERYSKPGTSLPYSYAECSLNSCAAAGPMQMTIGYDSYYDTTCSRCNYNINNNKLGCNNAWSGVSGQVKSLVGSSSVSPCNIRENMYGAAIKIKNDSTFVVYGGEDVDCTWPYPDIYNMQPVVNGMKWNIKAVYLSGCHYYNDCVTKNSNSGNKNYCEYLWDSLPSEHKIP